MTTRAAFLTLDERLGDLQQSVHNLQWAVVQAQPHPQQHHSLVEQLADAIDDLQQGIATAGQLAKQASTSQLDATDQLFLRQVLIDCQQHCMESRNLFSIRLSLSALDDLPTGHEADEWLPWAVGVKNALEWCGQALFAVDQAVFQCWQELSEQVPSVAVSVKTTNTGHQILLGKKQHGIPGVELDKHIEKPRDVTSKEDY